MEIFARSLLNYCTVIVPASYNNQTRYKKASDDDNVSKKQNDKKKGKGKGKENVQVYILYFATRNYITNKS